MADMVLAIDTVKGFFTEGNLANKENMAIVPNIKDLLERMTADGWKTYFLADNHRPDDLEFQMFPPHCVIETEEVEVVDELKQFVSYDNYIPKTRYSGFYGTNLEEILKREDPENIIVVGVYTDICVLYTTADLRNRDYRVTIPRDCVRALDAGNTDLWLNYLENLLGVQVVERQEEI
ncbi:MAG: isochorismatase family cysteine hydrolase [Patescibacteria group bacterium]|nr:isochorismatase family cysteine hydrolase [Patescibacteria group bacterium]